MKPRHLRVVEKVPAGELDLRSQRRLGVWIFLLRSLKPLSEAEVAEKLGLSLSELSKLEAGEQQSLKQELLEKVAAVFGMKLSLLQGMLTMEIDPVEYLDLADQAFAEVVTEKFPRRWRVLWRRFLRWHGWRDIYFILGVICFAWWFASLATLLADPWSPHLWLQFAVVTVILAIAFYFFGVPDVPEQQ